MADSLHLLTGTRDDQLRVRLIITGHVTSTTGGGKSYDRWLGRGRHAPTSGRRAVTLNDLELTAGSTFVWYRGEHVSSRLDVKLLDLDTFCCAAIYCTVWSSKAFASDICPLPKTIISDVCPCIWFPTLVNIRVYILILFFRSMK